MEKALTFYKAPLHYYDQKFSPKKCIESQHLSYKLQNFHSINSDVIKQKSKHRRTRSEASTNQDQPFSDSLVRLTIYNILANKLNERKASFVKQQIPIQKAQIKKFKPMSGYLSKIINQRKFTNYQPHSKPISKSVIVDELKVNKIKPIQNVNKFRRIQVKSDKQQRKQIRSNLIKVSPQLSIKFKQKSMPFEKKYNFNELKQNKQQNKPSYTLNIDQMIKRKYKTNTKFYINSFDNKINQQIQGWTDRSFNNQQTYKNHIIKNNNKLKSIHIKNKLFKTFYH